MPRSVEATLETSQLPIESLWTNTRPVVFDDINNPNSGGKLEADLNLTDTEVIARPIERILPPTESQQPENFTPINSEKYMTDVIKLRRFYYYTLGMQDEINVFRNYDPPLARAMWEQLTTEEEKRRFLEHETTQIIKSLGERYNVVESVARYTIGEDNKLYSEAFPNEPFENVVKRGVEHAKNLGSKDIKREETQFDGISRVQSAMARPNARRHSKQAAISGQGLVEGTTFIHNFVDIYELVGVDPVTQRRIVEMTRFTSNASYREYRANVLSIKSDYFNQASATDELHYAANPLEFDPATDSRSVSEIFAQIAGTVHGVLSKDNLQKIVDKSKARISYFLKSICSAIFDPQEVALRWNGLINGADIDAETEWQKLTKIPQRLFKSVTNFLKDIPIFKTIAEEVGWLGRQAVEQIMAACGLSGGFSIGGIVESIVEFISSAVSTISDIFTNLFKDKDFCIKCGACGRVIRRIVRRGQKCPICPAVRKC